MNKSTGKSNCLTHEELRATLETSGEVTAVVREHIEWCTQCQTRLNDLTDPESLWNYRDVANQVPFTGPVLDKGSETEIASTFDRYQVESRIGKGGMGEVFKAKDSELDRHVAVKILTACDDEISLKRFQREGRSVSRLNHPNIVPVLTTGTTKHGKPFIVMPLVEGPSLQQKLIDGPLDPKSAAELIRQIANGLHSAHQTGLIHRDVKPANILIDSTDGIAKLVDFGLVHTMGDQTITATEIMCGTPFYMSPEQSHIGKKCDASSDIYSLGVTLYHCITGSVPFRGSPVEILCQHRDVEPVSPRRLNNAVPRDLETICLKAISKEPAQRYHNAAAFAADLERFLADRPVSARPAGPIRKLIRWSRRNPALATAVALLFVSLLAGAIVSTYLWQRSEHNATLAKDRNVSLLANQKVLQKNQTAMRKALQNSFYDSMRDRSAFAQLPTSVRNTALISYHQSSQLLFDTSKEDLQALREITEDLSDVAEYALSFYMELRAAELSHLNRLVVEELLVLGRGQSSQDLARAAIAYNVYAEARKSLFENADPNPALLADAHEAFALARDYIQQAVLELPTDDPENWKDILDIELMRARVGDVMTDTTLSQEKRLFSLTSLYSEIRDASIDENLAEQWLQLQQQVLNDLAALSQGNDSIDYRSQRQAVLKSLLDLQFERDGKVDSWTQRKHAVNQLLMGRMFESQSEIAKAREYYVNASEQLQSLSELYALAGYYRISWFESLVLLARLDRNNNRPESALDSYQKAIRQIELLAQLNPQDENVSRRAAETYSDLGDLCLEMERFEQAGQSFHKGSEFALRTARNSFRMKPNVTSDTEFAIEHLEKAYTAFETANLPDQAAASRALIEQIQVSH